MWAGVDGGGFEMKNEEPGSLRTDESSRADTDGAGWYVGTGAAGSQHKAQDDGPVGVRRGWTETAFSPV